MSLYRKVRMSSNVSGRELVVYALDDSRTGTEGGLALTLSGVVEFTRDIRAADVLLGEAFTLPC